MLALDLAHQVRKPIPIRRARAYAEPLTVDGERLPVETLATEIQSDVQHQRPTLPSTRRAGSARPMT